MKFKVGDRVQKDMGVRLHGVVVRPFFWKEATDGTYRAPESRDRAVWVRWSDGTKGWISAAHLAPISSRDRRRARRDEVPSPRRHRGVEKDMLLGFLEAIWLDSYMSWAEEHGHGWHTGHIPQHVRSLADIPQAVPMSAKKLARKFAAVLVAANHARLTELYDRAVRAEQKKTGDDYVDPVKLGFYLAMQAAGHGISWTDDHASFRVVLPRIEWYAYGPKGKVKVEGYVSGSRAKARWKRPTGERL